MPKTAIILADGQFPFHKIPLDLLHSGIDIICCDGATANLVNFGIEPKYIVGDMDSISDELKQKYVDRIYPNPDQDTNDLTKAVNFCITHQYYRIFILGASGLREDHTIGNISLLITYANKGIHTYMITDYGMFTPILSTTTLKSYKGQQVSLFQITPNTLITTKGLMYPVAKHPFRQWWEGTLNEALDDSFEIKFDKGEIIVFQVH